LAKSSSPGSSRQLWQCLATMIWITGSSFTDSSPLVLITSFLFSVKSWDESSFLVCLIALVYWPLDYSLQWYPCSVQ
jgi:hypothetical protein